MPRNLRHLLLVCLTAAAAMAGAPALAQGIYGALAISQSTGAWGWGANYDNPQGARDRALLECRQRTRATDCQVYSTFSRACMALAQGGNNVFGWAYGYTEDERSERALNQCGFRNGTNCRIVHTFCSGTGR